MTLRLLTRLLLILFALAGSVLALVCAEVGSHG